MATYNPKKSQVSDSRLATFISAPITGSLDEVPGVAAKTIEKLEEQGINTTFQLIGKYLSLKDKDVGPVEHADRFYLWLQAIGTPGGHRAGVVHSIAERMNIIFPGIYEASLYDEIEDGDAKA
eukprot:gene11142-12421_t